jgi:hypothetical protein
MSLWSKLLNAEHIERVVSHAKTYPEVWKHAVEADRFRNSTKRASAFDLVLDLAYSIGRNIEIESAWGSPQ